MKKRADTLTVGDTIIEQRGKKTKLIEIHSIRRGGYVPESRSVLKKGKKRRTVPIEVSSTPQRFLEKSPVVINEEIVYDRTAWVDIFDPRYEAHQAIEKMANAKKEQ